MSQNIPRGFNGITSNQERVEQPIVGEHHDHHTEQEYESRDFGGRAL
jgi:hypothetical protein